MACSNELAFIRSGNYFRLIVSAARSKGGDIYLDRDILALVENSNFKKVSDKMVAYLRVELVGELVQRKHGGSVTIKSHQLKDLSSGDVLANRRRIELPPAPPDESGNLISLLELEAEALALELELLAAQFHHLLKAIKTMYTAATYYNKISNVDFSAAPKALRKGHEFVAKVTGDGANWANYESSATIKKVIDTYFVKLWEYQHPKEKERQGKAIQIKKGKKAEPAEKQERKPRAKKSKEKAEKSDPAFLPALLARIPEELRFIKRFVGLNGKTKTKEELLRFINSLQKAIVEKRIRKTSEWAEQIRYIQNGLIETYNTMKASIKIELKPETLEALTKFAKSEKLLVSVGFIKRYISMNEKAGMEEKGRDLLAQINRAIEKGNITDNDPYQLEIGDIKKNLESFIADKEIKVLRIERATLNGLSGILSGCKCRR